MRSHFLSVSFFKTVNTSPFRKVAVESAVCFGDAIAISIQPESRPSIAGYAHRLLEKKFVCFCGSKRRLPDEGRLLRLTASSTRPDAPACRRSSGGRGRTRGRIGANRSAGRCGCRSPARCRRARVCAAACGWGDRAGIPGRAFRRDGGCGLLIQRDSWTPLPDLESELRSPRTPQGGRERRRRGFGVAPRFQCVGMMSS